MSLVRLSLALLSALLLAAPAFAAEPAPSGAAAEQSAQALLSALHSNRKAVVAVNLGLSDAEAAKFWPIYDQYQKQMNGLGDRLLAVVEDYSKSYATLDDAHAKKLIDEYLTLEADRAEARRKWADSFAKVLPGRKLARFYQIENKIDAVLRYELAGTIPVVDELAQK